MKNSEKKIDILVVDDEKIITMHLEEVLTNFGYNVVGKASSGTEAVERAQKLKPDIILMDIIMPGDLSGIDAATEIKERFGIPVIYLSAFGDDSIVEKTKISEPFGYIMKPFKNQELKAAIELAIYKIEIENKLKESEEKYRTVAEQSRDGIGIVQDGVFKYVNPILFEYLGKPNNIYETPFHTFFSKIDIEHLNNIIRKIINERDYQQLIEFDLNCSESTSISIEANCSKIIYDGADAVLFFFRNNTQRKYFENILETQINGINENNQIIISNIERYMVTNGDKSLQEQFKKILSNLFQNANSLKKMYKLLQLEQEKSTFHPIDILEKINEAADVTNHQFPHKNIQVRTNIEGIIPKFYGDDLFDELFLALFENSIKNTDESNVNIETSIRPFDFGGKKFIEIKIEDNSRGISEANNPNLYSQIKLDHYSNNTGIDLTFVTMLLNRYLGEIEIQDRLSNSQSTGGVEEIAGGCVYNIRLPAMQS
jgi:PAS domain S-box-containing protein